VKKCSLKNYDVKIFPARLGWLKHFPASAQLKFGSASAQTFLGWTFAASALVPRSRNDTFRRIFHYKHFASVKCLSYAFGTMDINHTYDLHWWNFLKSLHKRCDRWL